MARHAAPTTLTRTKRRAAVAAGAMAATASLTVATPGLANAADDGSTTNPLTLQNLFKQSPQTILGILPMAPGSLPLMFLPGLEKQISDGAASWNSSPLGKQFKVTTEFTPSALPGMPGGLAFGAFGLPHTYTDADGEPWDGLLYEQKIGVEGQGFSVNTNTYGGLLFLIGTPTLGILLGTTSDGDLSEAAKSSVDVGSVAGNATDITGPFGSALNTDFWIVSAREKGVTSFTPGAKISATAPFGLGNVVFTFSPGAFAYGEGTVLLTLPSFGVALNTVDKDGNTKPFLDFGVNLGKVGLDHNRLVAAGPDFTAGGTNPSDASSTARFDVSTGSASLGLDGATITGPTAGSKTTSDKSTATVDLAAGSAAVGTGGVSVNGPEGTWTTDNGSTSKTTTADSGAVSVGPGGVTVERPELETSTTTKPSADKAGAPAADAPQSETPTAAAAPSATSTDSDSTTSGSSSGSSESSTTSSGSDATASSAND